MPKKVAMIGTGYVGLVTGVCFASKGHDVTCVDVIPEKVEQINEGKTPIFEPGLEELLLNARKEGRLEATLDVASAIKKAELIFIAVPTPSKEDGSIDLSFIEEVSHTIGKTIREVTDKKTVVVKSTVIPGTTEKVVGRIIEEESGKKRGIGFGLAMNPEFLKEGKAVEDFLDPDRIVIGAIDSESFNEVKALYEWAEAPILETSPTTAELIKYAANSFLAMKISFINEIANYCELLDVDVKDVAQGIGLDERISPKFLRAGAGFGGSCFPKDVAALYSHSKQLGRELILLRSTLEVNKQQPLRTVELLREEVGDLSGKTIAILGLAFKPDTDDMREAASIPIIEQLIKEGARVKATDPIAIPNAKKILSHPNINYYDKINDVLKEADALILVTEWDEYRQLSPSDLKSLMKGDVVIDGRRIWNPELFHKHGLRYRGIGLGKKKN